MSIKDKYRVMPITKEYFTSWILKKHYAKRMPPVSYAYGLFTKYGKLHGVCTFGIPASRFNLEYIVYELNRLIINEGLEKNILSFFVSQSLKQFPKKSVIIVSYADANWNHQGYIYQATNWVYTGSIDVRDYIKIDEKILHPKTLYNRYKTTQIEELKKKGINAIHVKEKEAKHRYFNFIGGKKIRKKMFLLIKNKYGIQDYPKGDNKRYEIKEEMKTNVKDLM